MERIAVAADARYDTMFGQHGFLDWTAASRKNSRRCSRRARVTGVGTGGYLACPNAVEGRAPGEGTSPEANAAPSGRLARWASRTARPVHCDAQRPA
jgi:hypothetical protein